MTDDIVRVFGDLDTVSLWVGRCVVLLGALTVLGAVFSWTAELTAAAFGWVVERWRSRRGAVVSVTPSTIERLQRDEDLGR